MKIKGIDLYKRLVNNDKSLLERKFISEEFGECRVALFGKSVEFLGLSKKSKNILSDQYPVDIYKILASEWKEVKERHVVSWRDLSDYITDDGFLDDRVKVSHKGVVYTPFNDVVGLSVNDNLSIEMEGEGEFLSYDMLINGEWFIEE